MTNRAMAAAKRRRRINTVMNVFAAALLLMCAAAFAHAMKQVDAPHEPSEEYLMYIENRDEDWFEMAEANEGEDPLESEHIEQAIMELPEKRYALTDEELRLVCGIVMHEAGGESYEGKMAVAQCILNQCEYENERPAGVAWKFAEPRESWPGDVLEAVTAVFHEGQTVTDDKILWFYAPAESAGTFHNTQRFVVEIGGHRFYAEAEGK
jgi:hypothetical protein